MSLMTRVLLVTNNPWWAGTEAQVAALASAFRGVPEFALHAAVFRPGVLVRVLGELGVPVRVVPVRWRLDVTAIRRLAGLLRAWRIDVLHSHGYKANVIGALAARMAGVRGVVRTEHGLPEPLAGFDRVKMALSLALDRWVGRFLTDAMIAVSGDVAGALQHRFPNVPVARVWNAIGPRPALRMARAAARRELELPVGAPVIGIVGRLTPIKDHATFLRAARAVAADGAGAHFLIAGTGPLEGTLRAEATRLGLGDRVHFRYLLDGAQPLLDALDVLVFSSRHEGMPYALLEALRAGVPVVATAVGGLAEALTHGRDALLVPPGDAAALAAGIHRVLREPGLSRRLAEEGRRTVESRFALDRMREETAAVYRETLRAASRAGRGVAARAGSAGRGLR